MTQWHCRLSEEPPVKQLELGVTLHLEALGTERVQLTVMNRLEGSFSTTTVDAASGASSRRSRHSGFRAVSS